MEQQFSQFSSSVTQKGSSNPNPLTLPGAGDESWGQFFGLVHFDLGVPNHLSPKIIHQILHQIISVAIGKKIEHEVDK